MCVHAATKYYFAKLLEIFLLMNMILQMKLCISVCHIDINQNKMQFKYVMVYLDEHQMKHLIIMDVPLSLDITT